MRSQRPLASAAALVVAGELYVAFRLGALGWNGQRDLTAPTLTALAVLALAGASWPWLPKGWRKCHGLAVSVVMGGLITRLLVLLALGFAWLSSSVSRRAWPTWLKLSLLLVAWGLITALRSWAPSGRMFAYGSFFLYWACLPTAVICLVVERSRGQLDDVTPLDDVTYLLALPRFFMPFLQPIGVRKFFDSRSEPSLRLAARAVGLGAWAVACLYGLSQLHYAIRGSGKVELASVAGHLLNNGALIYAVNAASIFVAIAILRSLGYDLGSGFRQPFLATSFSDFYRRWNYYFFEFVSGIFYMPLVTALRRRVPLSVAYVLAGYVSILLGVWMVDNFTFQIGVAGFGNEAWHELTDVSDLAVHFAIWSLIILPPLLLTKFRRYRNRGWWRWQAHTTTVAGGLAILLGLYWYGVTLY